MTAPFVLDHVFVAVAPESRAPERLTAAGFSPAPPRAHPGQGTANVCVHFEGGYLELLHARDAVELATPPVAVIGLGRRLDWRRTGASPFGLLLRNTAGARPPFPTVPYRAPFGEGRFVFQVAAEPVERGLPLVAFLPPDLPAHGGAAAHPNGASRFGAVTLDLPRRDSAALSWMVAAGLVTVHEAPGPRMTLRLGGTGGALDLEPDAPVNLAW